MLSVSEDDTSDQAIRLASQGRIMGIDYGTRRIGISLCDPTQTIASPLTTLHFRNEETLVKELQHLVKKHNVIALVVGWPLNMNGSAGEKTTQVERFLQLITGPLNLPVFSWDERRTTVSAQRVMMDQGKSPSKNRAAVDAIASAFILEAFLHRLHFQRNSFQTDK
jgi:putative holliday junction resolvase